MSLELQLHALGRQTTHGRLSARVAVRKPVNLPHHSGLSLQVMPLAGVSIQAREPRT